MTHRIINKTKAHYASGRPDIAISELQQHIAKCSNDERREFMSIEIDQHSSDRVFNIWYAANVHSAAWHYAYFDIDWFKQEKYYSDDVVAKHVTFLTTTISYIKYQHGIIEADEWYDWKYNNEENK